MALCNKWEPWFMALWATWRYKIPQLVTGLHVSWPAGWIKGELNENWEQITCRRCCASLFSLHLLQALMLLLGLSWLFSQIFQCLIWEALQHRWLDHLAVNFYLVYNSKKRQKKNMYLLCSMLLGHTAGLQ